MELIQQRGAIALDLDRPRILFFDMQATGLLVSKYGGRFLAALLEQKGPVVEVKDIGAMGYFLWAGLQADARRSGEQLTLSDVETMVRPWSYNEVANALVMALTGAMATPSPKTQAPGETATPAAAEAGAAKHGPGPTKVSTSLKRRGSPTESSTGPRRRSGR